MEVSTEKKQELLQRVAKGNEILYSEWKKACALAGNPEAWNYQMDRIERAYQKLDVLCHCLMAHGYRQCLYSDGRSCWQEGKWFCFVCPCDCKARQENLL